MVKIKKNDSLAKREMNSNRIAYSEDLPKTLRRETHSTNPGENLLSGFRRKK